MMRWCSDDGLVALSPLSSFLCSLPCQFVLIRLPNTRQVARRIVPHLSSSHLIFILTSHVTCADIVARLPASCTSTTRTPFTFSLERWYQLQSTHWRTVWSTGGTKISHVHRTMCHVWCSAPTSRNNDLLNDGVILDCFTSG